MRYKPIALALSLLLLAGCSAGQAPSPSPTPGETMPPAESPFPSHWATPAPEGLTAEEELLHYLDIVLAGDEVNLMCWLTRGSGPTGVDLAPYQEEVRALFTRLDWRYTGDEDTAVYEDSPAHWGYYLQAGDSSVNFSGSTRHDSVDLVYAGPEGTEPLRFAADGASRLAMDMVNLHPGPRIRFCLAEVPAEGVTSAQELAEGYAAAFERFYLDSGHITDFTLTHLEVIPDENGDDSLGRPFRMAFAVTPADPEEPYWQSLTADSDGRYLFDYEMHMLPDEDAIWRCDWYQS